MPRRSQPDCQRDTLGRLVLLGLTYEETLEFRKLDASLPYDGKAVWPDELPLLPIEERWLELWSKHHEAVDAISRRRPSLMPLG